MATASERQRHCHALGLPWDQDLQEEEVRWAWRRANLQWYPNRPGGNTARHTQAKEAYQVLCSQLLAPYSQRYRSPTPTPSVRSYASTFRSAASIHTPTPHPPPQLTTLSPLALGSDSSYSMQWHDGKRKLCLKLGVPLRTLVEGGRVTFQHLDGKEYSLGSASGGWGG